MWQYVHGCKGNLFKHIAGLDQVHPNEYGEEIQSNDNSKDKSNAFI